MTFKKDDFTKEKDPIIGLLSGVAIGYAITFIVFIGYALLLTYSEVSTKHMELIVIITTLTSVIIAGFDSAKNAKNRGLIWGVGAGLLYAVILIFVGCLVNTKIGIDSKAISTFLISMAGGGLGGILGINLKRKK